MGVIKFGVVVFVAGLAACGSEHNPALCEADTDCTDSTRPFCDVNGEYPESSYTPGECSVKPANCPLARCGCNPGESLTCAGGSATVCAPDGKSTVESTCGAGCSSDGKNCATFEISNGLASAFDDAAGEVDVVVPDGSTIDTDLGTINGAGGNPVAVKSSLVGQGMGQPSIRVFEGHSFVLDGVKVVGTNALALVAPQSITIRGTVDMSAKLAFGGPGSQVPPAVCAGVDAISSQCGPGASGAGNSVSGGDGGFNSMGGALLHGGALVPTFVPLVGGCRGGNMLSGTTVAAQGGGGGGAIQLVSGTQVDLRGLISLGGGGGGASAGGGSGGLLIIESPKLSVTAPGGIVANGAAAGGCAVAGPDALLSLSAAINSSCATAGTGGTSTAVPTGGVVCISGTQMCSCFAGSPPSPGGGGAAGRARIVTLDGSFAQVDAPILGAAITTARLTTN